MSNYDAWLEAPYQSMYAADDRYVDWCEENDLDPNDDHEAEWEAYVEAMSEPDPDDYYDRMRESRDDDYFNSTDY